MVNSRKDVRIILCYLEEILLAEVAACGLESLGESVSDGVGHGSVDRDIEAAVPRG